MRSLSESKEERSNQRSASMELHKKHWPEWEGETEFGRCSGRKILLPRHSNSRTYRKQGASATRVWIG